MPASALSRGLRLWLYDPDEGAADEAHAHPPILTVATPLSAQALLETFTEHAHGWFPADVADSVERIAELLAAEQELSQRWQGLPGTEHPHLWSTQEDGGDSLPPQSPQRMHRATILDGVQNGRLAIWHPPLWWAMPFVRHRKRHLKLDLLLAASLGELEAMVADAMPREWRRWPVQVRLEFETRVYWGARSRLTKASIADGTHGASRIASSSVWQPCRVRGDGITTSENLFVMQRGRITQGSLPPAQLTRHLQRHLHGGVGLLVVVPVIVFERTPRWHERVRQQLGAWRREAWRRVGWAHPADRDPTFGNRLEHDEPFWLAGTGDAAMDPHAWREALHDGAMLRPASRPAVDHFPQQLARGPKCHVVLIHGGLSSTLGSFGGWLSPAAPAGGPLWPNMQVLEEQMVWRFEHDTFLPLLHNITRLERWLAKRVIGNASHGDMVLVAHSRGGAVVRFALDRLRRRWPGWTFHAMTAGAPHLGTQVFRRIGDRWAPLSTLIRAARTLGADWLGREQLAQLLILERGLSYQIPPGFRDVEPVSVRRLAGGRPHELPPGMWLWGSAWGPEDAHPIEEGIWHWLVEDLGGAEVGGDGLVARESALAGRMMTDMNVHDASPVFHTHYFAHNPTREQMAQVLAQLLDR